jgi:hypothetical protein
MLRAVLTACITFCGLSATVADVFTYESVQVGGFYAGGATPDNSPTFQNYYVGYGSLTGGGRTPERRSFFHFSLPGLSGDVVSATLTLKLVIPGGLKFGKGPGDPAGPLPDDPFEEFQLGATFFPPSMVTSPTLTFPEITAIFSSFDDAPMAAPYAFGGGGAMETVEISLSAPGLTLLETFAGGDVVLTGWMPTWSFDSRIVPGSMPPMFAEGSELIFGLTDVSSGFAKPVLTITTAVPEAGAAWLLGAAALSCAGFRLRRRAA